MVGLTKNEPFELGAEVIELSHRRLESEGRTEVVERVVLPLIMDMDVDLDRPGPINQRESEADFLLIRIRVEQLPNHRFLPPSVIESSNRVNQFLQRLVLHIHLLTARTDGGVELESDLVKQLGLIHPNAFHLKLSFQLLHPLSRFGLAVQSGRSDSTKSVSCAKKPDSCRCKSSICPIVVSNEKAAFISPPSPFICSTTALT